MNEPAESSSQNSYGQIMKAPSLAGSFGVVIDDGISKKRYHLNRSYYGLYSYSMIWRELDNFSSGSVCMVLASNRYDESDYYREYAKFKLALETNA